MFSRQTLFLILLTSLLCFLSLENCEAQRLRSDTSTLFKKGRYDRGPYKINLWVDVPVAASLTASNFSISPFIGRLAGQTEAEVNSLDPLDINPFDKFTISQDYHSAKRAQKVSDWAMNLGVMLPASLMADKQIRKDWWKLAIMYLETQAIAGNVYFIAAGNYRRPRPLSYSEKFPMAERTGTNLTNSFYSGHVSTSTTAVFFLAKLLTDYHPEWGWKRCFPYIGALGYSTFVAIHRVKGMKHFPTDVLMGLTMGATIGWLVPELHRKKNRHLRLQPTGNGFSFVWNPQNL